MQTLHLCDSAHLVLLVSLWRLREYPLPTLLLYALSVHSMSSSSTISLPRHFNNLVDEDFLIVFLLLAPHLLMLSMTLLIVVEMILLLRTLHQIPIEL